MKSIQKTLLHTELELGIHLFRPIGVFFLERSIIFYKFYKVRKNGEFTLLIFRPALNYTNYLLTLPANTLKTNVSVFKQ